MKEIKKAIIYGRVSPTDDPNEDKIETQLFKVRNYCERMGWKVVKEFVEPGHVSGTVPIMNRPSAPEMVKFIEAGKCDVVVTSDDQRLTRSDDLVEWSIVIKALSKHNTFTANPQAGIEDVTSFAGRLMKILKLAFSAKEREDILARQQGGRDKAKSDNRYAAGGIPYGLRWVHLGKDHPNRGHWEAHEDQVKVLKRFFTLVKKGYALERIADQFNTDGILTKYGKKWASTTLNSMLKNDFYYTGTLAYKDGMTVDTGIKLFTKGEIEKIRKCRRAHPATKRKITKNGHYEPGTYLLRGLMFCECGRVMSPFKSNAGYYRCKRKECRTNGLNMRKTDKGVWDVFENKLTDSEVLHDVLKAENLIPGGNIKEALKRERIAEGKLKLIVESKSRFTINFGRHRMIEKDYEAEMAKLEKDELHWEQELAKAKNTTQDVDVLETESKAVADFFTNKMRAFHELKKVKMSLADADMATRLKFTPKLIEILKKWEIEVSKTDLGDPAKVKDLTSDFKRNLLKEAILLGAKVTSNKDGSIAVTMLPSDISVQASFG